MSGMTLTITATTLPTCRVVIVAAANLKMCGLMVAWPFELNPFTVPILPCSRPPAPVSNTPKEQGFALPGGDHHCSFGDALHKAKESSIAVTESFCRAREEPWRVTEVQASRRRRFCWESTIQTQHV